MNFLIRIYTFPSYQTNEKYIKSGPNSMVKNIVR